MIAWMLYATAIGALVSVASMAAETAAASLRLPTRFIWMFAAAMSVVWPFAGRSLGLIGQGPIQATVNQIPVAQEPNIATGPLVLEMQAAGPELLVLCWAAVTLGLTAFLAISFRRLELERKRWDRSELLGERVLLSRNRGPAVVGIWSPAVVLPEWILDRDEAEVRLILAHEQEHIRARDPLVFALVLILAALFPWNPALWWQLRRLRAALELDCDRRVVRLGIHPERYARTLLSVGEVRSGARSPAMAFAESRSFLSRRISAMTLPPLSVRRSLPIAVLTIAFAAVGAHALPVVDPPRHFVRPAWSGGDTLPIYEFSQVARGPRLLGEEGEVDYRKRQLDELATQGVRGRASWRMVVELDGTTRVVSVTADNPQLEDAVRRIQGRQRFEPALKDGAAVRTWSSGMVMLGVREPSSGENPYAEGYAAGRADAAATANPSASWGPEDARAALAAHHPALINGAPTPQIVYFVVTAGGSIEKSIVSNDLPAEVPEANDTQFNTVSTGGSGARLFVRRTPALTGVAHMEVSAVDLWRGPQLPRNVVVGWIVLER